MKVFKPLIVILLFVSALPPAWSRPLEKPIQLPNDIKGTYQAYGPMDVFSVDYSYYKPIDQGRYTAPKGYYGQNKRLRIVRHPGTKTLWISIADVDANDKLFDELYILKKYYKGKSIVRQAFLGESPQSFHQGSVEFAIEAAEESIELLVASEPMHLYPELFRKLQTEKDPKLKKSIRNQIEHKRRQAINMHLGGLLHLYQRDYLNPGDKALQQPPAPKNNFFRRREAILDNDTRAYFELKGPQRSFSVEYSYYIDEGGQKTIAPVGVFPQTKYLKMVRYKTTAKLWMLLADKSQLGELTSKLILIRNGDEKHPVEGLYLSDDARKLNRHKTRQVLNSADRLLKDPSKRTMDKGVKKKKKDDPLGWLNKFNKANRYIELSEEKDLNELLLMFQTDYLVQSNDKNGSKTRQEQDERNKSLLLLEEGRRYIKDNKLDEALKTFELVIEQYPELKKAYLARGDIYQVYKDYQKAIVEYNRLLEIHPRHAPAYLRKGYAYAGLKNWSKAIEQFSIAISYDPINIQAFEGRSEAYKNRGHQGQDSADFERSIKDYEAAEKLKKKGVGK